MKTIVQVVFVIFLSFITIQISAQNPFAKIHNSQHSNINNHPLQAHQCGTPTPSSDDIKRLLRHKAASQEIGFPKNNTYYIPIQFHVAGDADGNGYVSENTLLQSICKVNEDFADSEFQFYNSGEINYINDDILYNPDESLGTAFYVVNLVLPQKDPNAVNVFVVNTIYSPIGPGGAYFPNYPPLFPELDFILIRKDVLSEFRSVLTHELGHYFGLMHTFFGWEDYPYNVNQPTPEYHIAEDTLLNTIDTLYVEYADRMINCETSGDFFCDTPPDYFWAVPTNLCEYTGNAFDPAGEPIDPDERNYMSYFSDTCEQLFSQDQMDAMLANYLDRNELTSNTPPDLMAITEAAQLVAPINEEIVATLDEVNLVWDEVEHASNYYLQVSRFNNFTTPGFFEQYYLAESSFTLSNLVDNQTYHWRIWAFNSSTYCEGAMYSEAGVFLTDASATTSTEDLTLNNIELKISPNPISKEDSALNIWIAESLEDVSIQLYNLNGQLIKNISNQTLNSGWNASLNLNQTDLQEGLYFIKLQNSKINLTKKLIVK